jgi:hypothetical protein
MKRALVFARDFLLGFLIAWTVVAMWNISHGDNRILKKKGILVEWIICTKQDGIPAEMQSNSISEYKYVGFRVTYSQGEPLIYDKLH